MKKSVKFISLLLACGMLMSMASCSKKDKEPDAEEIQKEIDTVAEKLDELKSSDEYESLDTDEKAEIIIDELNSLAKKKYVDADSIYYDEEEKAVTYLYGSGVLACEMIDDFDESLCGSINANSERESIFNYDRTFVGQGDELQVDAIILDAMTHNNGVPQRHEDLATTWSELGVDTKWDTTVTLDDVANLSEYEYVFVQMHGLYLSYKESKVGRNIPVFFLEQEVGYKTSKKYKDDLLSLRVGVRNGNSYYITPDFFKEHYKEGDLSNTIFFFGSCQLMGKDTIYPEDWPEALEAASVPAFVAFHNSVYIYYSIDLSRVFLTCLLNGSTVEEALNAAIYIFGEDDLIWNSNYGHEDTTNHDAAFPILRGDYNAQISMGNVSTCPTEDPSDPDSIADTSELYKEYVNNVLVPQFGWANMQTFGYYLSAESGNGYMYDPIDSELEAEGLWSIDIDDYNNDGIDDMIVIYMYKESAAGLNSPYTDPDFFSYPQKEIYRTKLLAFSVSGGQVIKTDEYDVVHYKNTKEEEYSAGCLFPQEQDQKEFSIFKLLGYGEPSLLFEYCEDSGPMFKYSSSSAWLMKLDPNGKFQMQSYFINNGYGSIASSELYEFTNGTETSHQEYTSDNYSDAPSLWDHYDSLQIAYDEIKKDWYTDYELTENTNQVLLATYDTSLERDGDSYNYTVLITFRDGGNFSSGLH